jgi:hypothetical protein
MLTPPRPPPPSYGQKHMVKRAPPSKLDDECTTDDDCKHNEEFSYPLECKGQNFMQLFGKKGTCRPKKENSNKTAVSGQSQRANNTVSSGGSRKKKKNRKSKRGKKRKTGKGSRKKRK